MLKITLLKELLIRMTKQYYEDKVNKIETWFFRHFISKKYYIILYTIPYEPILIAQVVIQSK